MDKKMTKVQAKIVIEILGRPKEHVEDTMKKIVDKLKDEEKVKLLKETTYKAEEIEKMWSTFSDLEIEVEDVSQLVDICFDYMPSSIEILEPHKMDLETKKVSDLLNDLMAKLHKVDMLLKNTVAENNVLKRQLQQKKE